MQLRRCQRIDLVSTAARKRTRLDFHSAARTSQSGQATAAASEEDDSNTTPATFSRPKFGGGWGARAAPKRPAGLSTAEEASRKALLAVARTTPENQLPSSTAKSSLPKSSHDLLTLLSRRPDGYRTMEPTSRPRSRLQPESYGIPPNLRATDWDCPDCNYRCFGRNRTCPSCRAPRPELNPNFRRLDLSQQHIPIRKLGENVEVEESENEARDESEGKSQMEHVNLSESSSTRETAFRINTTLPDQEANQQRARAEDSTAEGQTSVTPDGRSVYSSEGEYYTQRTFHNTKNVKQRQSDYDDEYDLEERARRREKRKRNKRQKGVNEAQSPLYLPEFISVSNLADVLGVRPAHFVDRMIEMGFEGVTFDHVLDAETAGLIATEYNFEPIFDTGGQDLEAAPEPEDRSILPSRPPVVTIMGHVDHGKTTLLDWLRKSSVAASEHGGITQHIGAFSVSMPSGKSITFLDTPGHAAFLDMRRRGADVTDIVVLVVAADDSVKPQTIEAIKHAKQANVPIIVAINKIDKDNVNPERVKQDLARHGVDVEDFGGEVQAIPVSGMTGQGMVDLEEAIVTLSELLDHRADTEGAAEGWVVEATTKPAGRVATVLVRRGTIRPGDIVVAGTTWARIKTLKNEAGVLLDHATPGLPVEIDGWKEQPEAGSEVLQTSDEHRAKEAVEYRLERLETKKLGQDTTAINQNRRETLEQRRREAAEEDLDIAEVASGPRPINFLIKADVSGSVEAVVNSVSGIGNNELFAHVLRSAVGPISEFDVTHAATADACLVSFNVPVEPMISRLAESQGVKILNHNIIYELIDDVKSTMSEHLPPTVTPRVTGEAEISQIFEITVKGRRTTSIAGCKVRNGVISRSKKVRVLRDKEIVYEGTFHAVRTCQLFII